MSNHEHTILAFPRQKFHSAPAPQRRHVDEKKSAVVLTTISLQAGALQVAHGQAPLPTTIIRTQRDDHFRCPERNLSGGDKDFKANGPSVQYEYEITPTSSVVTLDLEFYAIENTWDFSEATYSSRRPLYTAPDCMIMSRFDSFTRARWTYVDTDHDLDRTNGAPNALVHRWAVRGDTTNDDIGRCNNDDTKFMAEFKPLEFEIDVDPACAPRITGVEKDTTALAQVISNLENTTTARLNNVGSLTPEFPFSVDDFNVSFAANDSFVQFLGNQSTFTIDRDTDSSDRFEFFINDMNSSSVEVEPDGGGLLIRISFEIQGIEIFGDCVAPSIECSILGDYIIQLQKFELGIRLSLEPDGAGRIQLAPVDPLNDIFVSVKVAGQSGPCREHIAAGIADECMSDEEMSLELQTSLQDDVGIFFENIVMSAAFTNLVDGLNLLLNPNQDVIGVIIVETGQDPELILVRGQP
ncbi:MAG TPA: hypothetical protein RMG48_05010 [Myxococcales bacterium LLY-WYZ-16_1]|nr:hypothetical protein [Myxococcales bacterium LLY-WYZ-16_1]